MLSKLNINHNDDSVKFTGVHMTNYDNSKVEGLLVTDCNLQVINSALTSAVFSTFPNIRYIEVFATNLREIVPGSFAVSGNSENVVNAYFLFNNITSLADGAFDGFSGVKKFYFVNNRLMDVAEGAFREMKSVTNLNLNYNEIKELPKNAFKAMEFLYSVDISNNQFEVLDGEIFDGNEMIQYITISYNKIVAIGRRFLAGMYQFNDFNAYNNVCVSGSYRYREVTMRALEKCFDNYDILFPKE